MALTDKIKWYIYKERGYWVLSPNKPKKVSKGLSVSDCYIGDKQDLIDECERVGVNYEIL